MQHFQDFSLSGPLQNAIDDLGFTTPTPIQCEAFNVIRSGRNVVGISQTGTGKTLAFMLPVLQELSFSNQQAPRILILVPTRELVMQIVEEIEKFTTYMTVRVLGIYGGTNINTQKKAVREGADILVATPGRIYDIAIDGDVKLSAIKQIVIDEVDVMLDLGFRFQLNNLFELLPAKRQNIMFSATMTEDVDRLIKNNFPDPVNISIAVSGTPLDNIQQSCYAVKNFYTKANLLAKLLKDRDTFEKVLVFLSGKKNADRLFDKTEEVFGDEVGVIHSNKSQNYRFKAIERFEGGSCRVLIATDVMARGLDLNEITHVINFDTPVFPENYMHRIGRTGRAEKNGNAILFYTENEEAAKLRIEELMNYDIPEFEFPEDVVISNQLIPSERPKAYVYKNPDRNKKDNESGAAFHEKKAKNQKTNQGGKYKRELKKKYKKPKTRSGKKRK